ncbi:MAG: hypothetical protein ACRDJF_07710 [Actinomycetota bacterium]
MATAKEFTGWISVEGGLINLQHARRISLVEVENTYLVVAYLEDDEQVTLAATDKREVAEKALRYLAANVKAIYAVRQ